MKKFLTVLYILLIALVTFFLVPIFSVTGSTNFLEHYQELFESNNLDLISGTTLAFRNNGTSSLIQKEPLFSNYYEIKENNNVTYKFNLDFYSIIEKKGRKYNSGLFVIINDIYLNDSDTTNKVVLDEFDRYLIRFEMFFNEPIDYKDNKIYKSEDVFIPLYDGKSGVLFFDQSFLKNENGFVEIEKISLSVKTLRSTYITLLNLYNNEALANPLEDVFGDVNRDISNLSSENINLLGRVNIETIYDNEAIYYNKQLFKTFRTKYNFFVYFIIIWIILVTALTYFLFIHKYVKLKLEERKKQKQIEFEKLKERIKMEEK